MSSKSFMKADVVKVDSELGLVFGWGIVCKVDGEDFFDSQHDHIPEHAMLRATADFMLKSRMSGDMHARDGESQPVQDGDVVFSFPMTTEIAKALEIETSKTGWLVAIKPSPEVLAKYKDGSYTGFSIGGSRLKDENAEEVGKGGGNPNHDPEDGQFTSGSSHQSPPRGGGDGKVKENYKPRGEYYGGLDRKKTKASVRGVLEYQYETGKKWKAGTTNLGEPLAPVGSPMYQAWVAGFQGKPLWGDYD